MEPNPYMLDSAASVSLLLPLCWSAFHLRSIRKQTKNKQKENQFFDLDIYKNMFQMDRWRRALWDWPPRWIDVNIRYKIGSSTEESSFSSYYDNPIDEKFRNSYIQLPSMHGAKESTNKHTHHSSASSSNQSRTVLRSFVIRGVIALRDFGRLNVSSSTCSTGNVTLSSEEWCGGWRCAILSSSTTGRN